jgi:hypothetical protein
MTREAITAMMDEWPIGAIVWHKANGARGVIQHHHVSSEGVLIGVDYGSDTSGYRNEYPICLSATKVSTQDGDEWKEATA